MTGVSFYDMKRQLCELIIKIYIMENQFTKGKWVVANIGNIIQVETSDGVICRLINQGASVKPREEEEANAKLISAAPDLLKSLNAIAVAGQLALHSGDNAKHGFTEMAIANALHAIKQATQP